MDTTIFVLDLWVLSYGDKAWYCCVYYWVWYAGKTILNDSILLDKSLFPLISFVTLWYFNGLQNANENIFFQSRIVTLILWYDYHKLKYNYIK